MINFQLKSFFYSVLVCFFLIFSCRSKIERKELLKWLDDPANGLVVTKKSNAFELKMKYLPTGYFVSREFALHADSLVNKVWADSIEKEYKGNIYFLLHIDNDPDIVIKESDVMFRDIHNYGDYVDRIYKYNFDISEDIVLRKNGQEYHPVLATFENHYGLEGGRNLLLVFSPAKDANEFSKISDLEITFKEQELGIGTTHFFFKGKDISSVPELIL